MLKHDRLTGGSSATPPGHAAPTEPRTGRRSWPSAAIVFLAIAVITAAILVMRGERAGGPAATRTRSTTSNSKPATPTPSASPRPAACRLSQLAISVSEVGRGEGGMGHSSSALLFGNVGGTACVLHGYPDITGLDDGGRPLAVARHTLRGYLGGLDPAFTAPPTVTLAAGHTAAALVEALNAAPDGTACTPLVTLRVGVPGDPGSRSVAWGDASGCARLEVHPFVPSSDGHMDPVDPNHGA